MKVQAVLTIRREVGRDAEGYAEVSVRFEGHVDEHPHRDDQYLVTGRVVVEPWPGEVNEVSDLTPRELARLDDALALSFQVAAERSRLTRMSPADRAREARWEAFLMEDS